MRSLISTAMLFMLFYSQNVLAQTGKILAVSPLPGTYEGRLVQKNGGARYSFSLTIKEHKSELSGTSTIRTESGDAYGIYKFKGKVNGSTIELEESDLTKHDGPYAWYRKKMNLKLEGESLKGTWNEADSNADQGTIELIKKDKP